MAAIRERVLAVLLPALIMFFTGCGHESVSVESPWQIQDDLLTHTIYVGQQFVDTIRVVSSVEPVVRLQLASTLPGVSIKDSVVSWTPLIADTGNREILVVAKSSQSSDTLHITLIVLPFWPDACPAYTHTEDDNIGSVAELPDGYFVFDQRDTSGLYKSFIHTYAPVLLPNTGKDQPRSISISEDGHWIAFVNQITGIPYVIQSNGANKTRVPVTISDPGLPLFIGFYRKSPYGSELFYPSSRNQLRAVTIAFSSGKPVFQNDRLIVDLPFAYTMNIDATMQFSVVGDQVYGGIYPVDNGKSYDRSAFLTIPDAGRGIGGPDNIFKWANDSLKVMDGCGHTQSFDGLFTLSNPGWGYTSSCLPRGHIGFCITPFRRDTDMPIRLNEEHFNKFGISINWAPKKFRQVGYVNFWGWYFSNVDDYVVGRQMQDHSYAGLHDGIWVVKWKTNSWIPLTPPDIDVHSWQPAIYFGNFEGIGKEYVDTTAPNPSIGDTIATYADLNPRYRVLQPNGGEVFRVAQICSVKVASVRSGKAMLEWSLNGGRTFWPLPGFSTSINPQVDSIFVFTIPAAITTKQGDLSTISDQCVIKISDYSQAGAYFDISDSLFRIMP